MLFCRFAVLVTLATMFGVCPGSAQTELTISAAASLKDAIVDEETTYRQSGAIIAFANNFGSSGTLAVQIGQGAPVDIFMSAAAKPMDDLAANGLIVTGTRRNLLRNTLVLIAPVDSKLRGFQGLTDKSIRLIALGDPASVPAGQYGKQTLLSFHLWEQLSAKFVLGKDVRQVLTYVETGNADAGLVYATDAMISSKARVVASAPEATHEPIVYPAAVVKGSRNERAARAFIEFLTGPSARAIFQSRGFTIATP